MDEENNTIDLEKAYLEALDNNDNARLSVISKLMQAEDQGLAGSDAWREASQRGNPNYGNGFLTSAVPGVVSSVVTDTLGAVNVLNPLYVGEGESEDYGPINYFGDVFSGAISGETPKGEMFISHEDLEANPNIFEWVENTQQIMEQNAAEQLDKFSEDNNLFSKEKYDEFVTNATIAEAEGPEYDLWRKLINQHENSQPYIAAENGIIIRDDLLPPISMDVDPKFTDKGDLSLPYAGLFGYNDEGEFVMKRPSMFRFTDELTRGKEGSKLLEATEDYLYPNINARFSYGDKPAETLGYMAGQFAPSGRMLYNLGKSGVTAATRGTKGIINYLTGKNAKVLDDINYSKIEPYLDEGIGTLIE